MAIIPEHSRSAPTQTRSSWWVWVALVISLAVLAALLMNLAHQKAADGDWVDDFVEYWAAGRLNLHGGNPYAADELLAVQAAVGWNEQSPIMMWNPPPALALVMPFGLLDYSAARVLWFVVQALLIVVSIEALGRLYGSQGRNRYWTFALGLLFVPVLSALQMGQIGGVVLAGITGFLVAGRRGRWTLAGALLALAIIKPHVVYLLWVAAAIWWLGQRKLGLVLGPALAVDGGWLIATAVNPSVTAQYLEAVATAPPLYWETVTFGALLRMAIDPQMGALQFVPPLIGLAWLAAWWSRNRPLDDWADVTPIILLISAMTMAFGWIFDLVVLLPAVVRIAVWLAHEPALGRRIAWAAFFVAYNAAAFWLVNAEFGSVWFVWMAPVLLVAYLVLRRRAAALVGGAGSATLA